MWQNDDISKLVKFFLDTARETIMKLFWSAHFSRVSESSYKLFILFKQNENKSDLRTLESLYYSQRFTSNFVCLLHPPCLSSHTKHNFNSIQGIRVLPFVKNGSLTNCFVPFSTFLSSHLSCIYKTPLFDHFLSMLTDLPFSPSSVLMGSPFGTMRALQSGEARNKGEVLTEMEEGMEVAVLVRLWHGAVALTKPPVALCGK